MRDARWRVARRRQRRHYRGNPQRRQRDARRASRPAPRRPPPTDEHRPQRAVRDVRPAAARFRLLLRRVAGADAESRPPGGGGRALRQRLRPVRRVRPVADVVLHRPLRELARRDVEPRAAVGGRAHAGRLSARGGAQRDARRQDARAAGLPRRSRASASKSSRSAARCCARAASRCVDRYDGHTPPGPESGYAAWLRERGYGGADPWSDYVIGVDDGGRFASGWQMRNVHLPSRVAERALRDRVHDRSRARLDPRRRASTPWVLHLSYVKPHWPYVAPAPYHAMFRGADVGPIRRGPQDGTADEHPVVRAYREHDECLTFARRSGRRATCAPRTWASSRSSTIIFGRLLDALAAIGPPARHADRVHVGPRRILGRPRTGREGALLRRDRPRAAHRLRSRSARRCDARRADARFVEGDRRRARRSSTRSGIAGAPHRIEGRSLLPMTRGEAAATGATQCSPSSITDSAGRGACSGEASASAAAFMVRTERVEVRALGRLPAAAFRPRCATRSELRRSRRRSRGTTRCARGCANACSTGSPRCKRRTTVSRRRRRSAHRCASRARHPHRRLVTGGGRRFDSERISAIIGPSRRRRRRRPIAVRG